MDRTAENRFFAKVVEQDGCWIWTASRSTTGYGQFNPGGSGRIRKAHRWSWEFFNGPIPAGLELDHLCRQPLCVNPEHLDPVSHKENVRRGRGGDRNRNKTHCPQGHPLEAGNLSEWCLQRGRRSCRICMSETVRRHRKAQHDRAS